MLAHEESRVLSPLPCWYSGTELWQEVMLSLLPVPMLQARRDSRTPKPVQGSGCPVPVPAAHWDFFASCKMVMGEDLCSREPRRHAASLCVHPGQRLSLTSLAGEAPKPPMVPSNQWLLEQVPCPMSWTWRGAGLSWVWLPHSEVQGTLQARLCLWVPKLERLPAP